MTDSNPQRLPSAHLEDFAYVVLSARPDAEHLDLYPDIDDEMRVRLRSRIKQLSRYDWPSSLRADPAFRRGLTLRQCLRLAVTLLLLDAHLPPSLAVMMVQNNEMGLLRATAKVLQDPSKHGTGDDLLAVILATEIQDTLGFSNRAAIQEGRIRFLQRDQLARLWSDDLGGSGARLLIDVPTTVTTVWRWISGRRLMNDRARINLLSDVASYEGQADFNLKADRNLRR